MDGAKDYLKGGIPQAGKCLVKLLEEALCPDFVGDRDAITLLSPWGEADYRVGIYLYDIQDHSPMAAQGVPEDGGGIRFPPKTVELSYMIFCNENDRFGGVRLEQIHTLLNEVVRTVYDHPVLTGEDGGQIQIVFAREPLDFKIRLWESFSKPLRPAVYIQAFPVAISSRRICRAPRVTERDYRTVNSFGGGERREK